MMAPCSLATEMNKYYLLRASQCFLCVHNVFRLKPVLCSPDNNLMTSDLCLLGAAVQAESSINVDFDAVFGGGARGIANNGVQPAADGKENHTLNE